MASYGQAKRELAEAKRLQQQSSREVARLQKMADSAAPRRSSSKGTRPHRRSRSSSRSRSKGTRPRRRTTPAQRRSRSQSRRRSKARDSGDGTSTTSTSRSSSSKRGKFWGTIPKKWHHLSRAEASKRFEQRQASLAARGVDSVSSSESPSASSSAPATWVCTQCYGHNLKAAKQCATCAAPRTYKAAAVSIEPTPSPTATAAVAAIKASTKELQAPSFRQTELLSKQPAAAAPNTGASAMQGVQTDAQDTADVQQEVLSRTTQRAAAVTELQQTRLKLVEQRDALAALVPGAVAAVDAKIAEVDSAIVAKRAEQLGDAQPHQVAEIVAAHQSALGAAQLELAAQQAKMDQRLAAFDQHAASVASDFDRQIAALVAAKSAAAQGFVSEREDIAAAHQRLVSAATSKADTAKAMLEQASAQQQRQAGTTSVPPITVHPPPVIAQRAEPSEDELPPLAKAIEVLEHHQCQDEVFPISYGTLGLEPAYIASLVGQQVWLAAYPPLPDGSPRAPSHTAELPNRVLGTLRVVLGRMAIAHSARQAASAEAVAAVTRAAEAHSTKRTRTEP